MSKNDCPDPVRAPQHSAEALLGRFLKLPNNKKPGVERRAKSPIQVTLREARLVLSGVARKEPHYRVYFRPSLGAALGRTLLLPDCDALLGSTTPEPFVSIQDLSDTSSVLKKYF